MTLDDVVSESKPEWLTKADDWLANASRKGGNLLVSAFGNRVTLAARVAGMASIGAIGYSVEMDNPFLFLAGLCSGAVSCYIQLHELWDEHSRTLPPSMRAYRGK